ncbi:uncharacterized protein [Cherax quadricarinatus]|uniref:uncharacterized protein n=1 Tax=Cherax quadricarinatus TaxID=27406 RepID=UPI00387E751F
MEQPPKQFIVLPCGDVATNTRRALAMSNINVSTINTSSIKDLTTKRSPTPLTSTAGVYTIPCGFCPKKYVGETGRDLAVRLNEHRNASNRDDVRYACVIHRDSTGHLMNWNEAQLVLTEPDLRRRRCLEASLIAVTDTIERNTGNYKISKTLAYMILKQHQPNNTGVT